MNVRDLLRVQMLLLHVEVPIPVQVVHAVVLLMKELAAEALLQVEAQITEQVEAAQEAAVQAVQVHQTQLNQQLLVYQLIKMMGKNNNYGGTFA